MRGVISGDLPMERSNIDDSSIGRNTQPAMSGNTREVEMKTTSEDLPIPDLGTSQGDDY